MKRSILFVALSFIFFAAHAAQPQILSVAYATGNGTYKVGDNIDITVTFDQVVNVLSGPPRILLNANAGAFANYFSGTGTAILTFRYTVGATHSSADLDYAATTDLTFNGGTIKNVGLEDAILTLPPVGTLATASSIIVDGIVPVISATTPVTNDFKNNTQVSFTLSEAIASGSVTWTHTGGTADGSSPHVKALAGTELNSGTHSNITLTNNPTLVSGAIYTVTFNATDVAGNAATTITSTNITFDNSSPVISATTPASSALTNNTQVSYTLSEAIASGTITWTQTGGTPDGSSPHVKALTGTELNTGAHSNITLTNNPTLVDGAIYSVSFDATDAAGNTATTVTNTSVTYDGTTPVISSTTPITNDKINSTIVSYTLSETITSGSITWTRTGGTADASSPHVKALTGTELNTGAHSNITLTNNPTLVNGAIYTITFNAADLVNTATAITNTNITFDNSPPVITATAPATSAVKNNTRVSYTLSEAIASGSITWTRTGGTADGSSPHVKALTGTELNTGAHSNIFITNNPTLVDGAIYSVSFDATDAAGNTATTITNTNITYDGSAPVISATAPATNAKVNITNVSYTLSENVVSGSITWTRTGGTADGGSPHVQAITGTELNAGAHSDITLNNDPTLVNGTIYTITFNATDAAGNTATTITNTDVTYDTSPPAITATAPASSALRSNTQVSYTLSEAIASGSITWTQTGGTADGSSPHVKALTGTELNTGAHTNITLTNNPTLVDGAIYSVSFDATDIAGNIGTTVTNTNITYDGTTPVISATAPAASARVNSTTVSYTLSETVVSGSITWTRTGGTADPGSPHVKALAGAELNSGAHTNITLTNNPTLVNGATYTVTFNASDLVNAATTITNTGVIYDTSPPTITATAPASGALKNNNQVSYTLSEAIASGSITWTQTGGTADGSSPHVKALTGTELNTGAHNNIILTNNPTLVTGAIYSVSFNATDLAGNTATAVTNTNVSYDFAVPTITSVAPITNARVNTAKVSYTLSENIASGTITWTRTGGTADGGSPRVQALTGTELDAGAHTNITLTNNPALVNGTIYTVTFNGTDAHGNVATTVTSTNVTFDTTVPTITATAPATNAFRNNTQVSYTLSEAIASGTVTWTRTSGTADGASPHVKALTGTELNTGAHNNITLTNFPTLVDGAFYTITFNATDLAGNVATAVSNTNIKYDVTPPTIISAEFFASLTASNDPNFDLCSATTRDRTSSREFVHLTMSEPLNITEGVSPTIGSPGFAASAGVFDVVCSDRGGTVYHPNNVIHLQVEFASTSPDVDGAWNASTTFSFTTGGTNVKDLAGNEMGNVPVISTTAQPPVLASGMVLNPNGASNEIITFTVDQTLNTSPAAGAVTGITVDPDGAGPSPAVSRPGTYTASGNIISVTSANPGDWSNATTVSYTPGNLAGATGVSMLAFSSEPILLKSINIVSNNALSPTTRAKLGDVITLTFTASRTLAADPIVTIGTPAQTATKDGSVIAPNYKYTYNTTPDVINNGVVLFSITADETGPPDKQTIATITTDLSSITYDKVPPAAPAALDFANADDSGLINTDNYTKNNTDLDFSGTAETSSTVKLYNGVTLIGTTTADPTTGAWAITAYPNPATLSDGVYSITATATDAAGNVSVASSTLTLTIDNTPPNVVSILRIAPPTVNSWSTTNGTSANTVTFRVTFDENVTGIDYSGGGGGGGSASFQRNLTGDVNIGGISGATFTTSNYVDVTVSGITGTGRLGINFLDKDNVVNAVGDPVGGVVNGDFISDFTPVDEYYTIVLPEPSSSVTSFGQSTTTTSVTVNWNHASLPLTQATHYFIRLKRSTSTFSPVTFTDGIPGGSPGNDGVDYTDNNFADGTLAAYVTYPTNNHTFTGLTSGMQYNIEIYPLTSTSNYLSDNWNYKFTSPLTGNATTGTGQLTAMSVVSVADSISTLKDTPGEIFDVFTFQIQDDGSTPGADNAHFKFSALTITPAGINGISDWTQAIGGASLTANVGGTIAGTVQYNVFSPNTSSIVFNAGTSDDPTDFGFISDNQIKTYTLSIWLKPDMDGSLNLPSIIDGLRFGFLSSSTNFTLENGTLSQASSQFFSGTSAQTSAGIVVDVDASKLAFATPGTPGTATNPQSSIGVKTSFAASSAADPLVYALDVNNNLDLDYETARGNAGSISNTLTLGQSTSSIAFSNGVLTLNPLSFTTAGVNTQIVVAGVGNPSVTSATSTNVSAVISNRTTISDATAPASELASFTSITTAEPANFNFDFTITDDVGANTSTFADNDALPTLIQTITIAQNSNNGTNGGGDVTTFDDWAKSIGGAELTDGTSSVTILPGSNITGNSLIFNVSSTSMATVSEGTPKTYELRIWLKNPVDAALRDVLDNKDFAFNIDQSNIIIDPADANATSTMTSSGASTGDGRNVVTVTATQLDFVTQPPATQNYDVNLTTTPVVKARDANQNLDVNYTSNATLTSFEALTPSFPLSTTAFTFVSGVVNLTPVAVGSSGGGLNNNVIQLQLNDNPDVGTVASALSSNIQLTYSGESDIVKDPAFVTSGSVGNTYTPNIEFINNIAGSITAANSIALERFLLRDGGSDLADSDGSNTKLATITLNVENYANIQQIGIYDGATEIQELPSTSFSATGDITFTGITTFEATDNSQKSLTVRVSFKTTVTDNQALRVRVVSASAGGVSSQISAASTSFVTLTGNDNKIEVVATKITFDNAPASASANVSVNPPSNPLRVTARDLYNNHDQDYNGAISFSGTPPASGNTAEYDVDNLPTGSFAGGILDYPIDDVLTPLDDEGYQFLSGTTFTQLTINGAVATLPGSVHNGTPITGISPAPGVEIKTSFDSWLYFDPSFSYTTRIPFISMQEATLTNTTNSVELARLVLSDGGAPGSTVTATNTSPGTKNMAFGLHNDIDAAFTKIESFTISLTKFGDIRKIALFDASGVKVPGTEQNAAASVTFTGLSSVSSLWAADDNVSRFYIRASFNSAVTDRDSIIMQITNVAWSSGSRFPLSDGTTTVGGINGAGSGGDTSDATKNIINVVATKFDFMGSQSDYAGINQPMPLPPLTAFEVRARDGFQNLDTEFHYATSSTLYGVKVTTPGASPSGTFTFVNGIMMMSGLEYTSVGDGTLTVESIDNPSVHSNVNNTSVTPSIVADQCEPIQVIHTVATQNFNGPTSAVNLKGGTNNVVIFGVTFTSNNPDNTNDQPKLKQFTFSFDDPYRTSLTAATLKNFRVFESLTGTYVSGTTPNVTLNNATVTEGKSAGLSNPNHRDLVTVTFANGFYRNIADNTYSFYLMCDIDATASNATEPLQPRLLSGGYHSLDYGNIVVTEGSVFANVLGTEFGFASVKPPKLVASSPTNGQLNVDPNLGSLQLTFDVPVWTLDGKAYLYDSAGNKIADLPAINGKNIPTIPILQPVTGGQNSPTPPLTFTMPPLDPNEVYYILIDKGVNDIQNPANNRGIMDDQSNLYGGLTYSGGLRFKTANPNPPKMKDTDSNKYFISASGGIINASFDQRGKAYFMVTNAGALAPTNAQIVGTAVYPGTSGTVYGRDTIDIKLINTLQYGSFTASTPLVATPTQYAVWMYAENDALPAPVATSYPYMSSASNFAQNTTLATTPTFIFSYTANTGLYLNRPGFQICSESFVTLADPIIIEEGALNDFYYFNGTDNKQSFNLLLPQGFEFDRNTIPSVELIGEFTGKATPTFTNNTILKVQFVNIGSSRIDKIVITGIRLRGESGLASASIQRLGGSAIPGLADETDVATISVLDADPGTFTNSYTILNTDAFASIGINNVVTVIPDNFSDPSLTSSNSTRLISTITGDYGPVEFIGSGVSNEVLSLTGVALNTSFSITMKHTDMNGCISEVSQNYTVYDHNTAIPGLPTKQAIVNKSFPSRAPSYYPEDSVLYSTVAGYGLDTLIAGVPDRVVVGSDEIDPSPEWLRLISLIPQLNTANDAYGFDYRYILNDSIYADSIYAGTGVLFKQAYNYFRKSTIGNRYYYEGGSMGLIEFTGRYRNIADTSVLIPLKQEVEIFIPPIPVVEIAANEIKGYDPADPLNTGNQAALWPQGVPVFCENGVDILVNGYPRAVQGLSTGSFTIVHPTLDTLISNGTEPEFIDNGNGTATLKLGLLVAKTNNYNDIKILYRYHKDISPVDSVGSLIIRISPNPIAEFEHYSVLPEDSVVLNVKNVDADGFNHLPRRLEDGRPALDSSYCEGNWIYFINTTSFPPTPNTYVARTAPRWEMGDPLSATNNKTLPDTVFFKYDTYGTYTVKFSVESQYNCPSQEFSAPIYVGVIPTPNFKMSGISTTTPLKVRSETSISSGVNYPLSDTIASSWNFNSLPVTDEGTLTYSTLNDTTYTVPGHYLVTLKATTQITTQASGGTIEPGCEISYQRPVIIVPALTSSDVGTEALDDFEDSDPLKQWQSSDTDPLVSSWERGDATESSSITLTGNVWATDLDGPYNDGEVSFLYSPAYDLSDLARPKVGFDQVAFMGINDGVALEFSVDTFNIADPAKKWFRIGSNANGNNWYNKPGLASSPGDQTDFNTGLTSGDYGWSTQLDTVLHSQHTLTPDLPEGRRNNVIFRFAMASLAGSSSEGFAFDNFRVGERTRVVLIENFTNLGNAHTVNGVIVEKSESDSLKTSFFSGVGTDLIKLNYHVGFPELDPFNDDYPADPSARALFYNISETPIARMDGGKSNDPDKKYFSEWGKEHYNIRTLQLAQAELQITQTGPSENGGFKFSVTVTASHAKLEKDTTILHIAFVEAAPVLTGSDLDLVKTGETDFEYVVKQMVPSALGTRLSVELAIGESFTFENLEWNPDLQKLYDNPNDLAIVAFLQNEFTREVYQAEILTALTDPTLVTGTEDPDYGKRINLYPNPANSEVNIQLPTSVSKTTPVIMFDSFGRTVYQDTFKVGEQSKTVKTSEFAGGMYFIQVNTPDGNIARRKVMVLHR